MRLILRHLLRHPVKTFMGTLGIATGMSVVVATLAMLGSIDTIRQLQFYQIEREDIAVFFGEPRPYGARFALANVPGVNAVEAFRMVPVRLRNEHREERTAITGLAPGTQLRRVVDTRNQIHHVPDNGVLLSSALAKRLGVRPGDVVTVELTEGERRTSGVQVTGLVDELMGMNAYMSLTSVNLLDGRGDALISGAWLSVDERRDSLVQRQLKGMPAVTGVVSMASLREGFDRTIAQSLLISLVFIFGSAAALVGAIVYNHARISLSERARDLGSLRVLGFSNREVSAMLISDQSALILLAVPIGAFMAYLLCLVLTSRFESDLFRLPLAIGVRDVVLGVILTIAAAGLSALLVLRRLARMDVIAVLKTRE